MISLFKGYCSLIGAFTLYAWCTLLYWRCIVVYVTSSEQQKLLDSLHLVWIGVGGLIPVFLISLFLKYKKIDIKE
jgi:hypothetical protein